MKIALVTMNVKAGKCEENFKFMISKIQQARVDGADIIVFPQNAVSGYLLGDVWLEDAWCSYVDSFNERLLDESHDIAIVWGNIRYRNHRRFNAAFFAYQGISHMRVKQNEQLPYMEDSRYFEPNDINSAIEFKDMFFALNFGEEVQLADMNISIDANPYDIDKDKNIHGNVIYANACGMQNIDKNVMIMSGGSRILRNGKLLYHAAFFKEDYAVVDMMDTKDVKTPDKRLLDALTSGIQEFDQQVFQGKLPWIVGMSGGLDSSITCALLVHALGNDRIYGYNLATKHNREITKNNARTEAEALGVHYKEGAIEDFMIASKQTFLNEFDYDVDSYPVLVNENMQARARGYLLSGFAGALGGVVVNNANKVEAMLGYCTLYGDSIGALSMIGDLSKVQLFELSKALNLEFKKEVIPINLLPTRKGNNLSWVMPPSAELKGEQLDPMKWFYHDYLVEHLDKDFDVFTYMRKYLHHELPETVNAWITYYHLDDPKAFLDDLDWFLNTRNRNAFKRLQLPPLLSVHHQTLCNMKASQMNYDKEMYQNIRNEILKG